ncbi:MAG TPA: AAA family ATPase [Candidatus Dormibacteraeota bacterium]|nr:AAA family ATPase [Candidatus Dormibacteraeota bacterium]
MKLTRLVMHGFRSYREPVEVRFERGANVFLGRNEAGKTGILLAIQAALYPPRLATEREALVSEGSDVCRVGLEYELADGRVIRVDRDLVAHKGSIAELRESGSVALASAPGDIAQVVREHTGCDEALFRATLLVRHEGVEIGDADDLTRSLSERIEVLVSGSPGGISAARAVRKLEEKVKGLSGPRAGEITQAETRLRDAESRLASARSRTRRLEEGRPRLEELEGRSAELEEELAGGQAVLDRARKVAASEARRAALVSARAGIDRTLDAQSALERLEREVQQARLVAPTSGSRKWPYLVAAVLATGGLISLALHLWLVGICLFAVAGLGALAAFVLRSGPPSRPAAGSPPARMGEREADSQPSSKLVEERARLGRDLEEVEAAIAEAAIHRLPPAELARLEVRVGQLPELIRSSREAGIRAEVEMRQLEDTGAPLAELEDEVTVAGREVERLELRLAAMKLARDELQAAIRDIRQGVGPELAEQAGRLLATVAPDYSVALAGGEGLAFRPAGPGGEELGRRQLSDGTLDQFHFAVRVALADVLLGDLRPPLLLDDPFRYADAGRRESLHAMLESIGAERQVLYFTVEDPAPLAVTHRLPVVASRAGSE